MAIERQKVLYNLGSFQRIPPGEGRMFTLEGLTVAVFHTRDRQFFATQASCPHQGGPLADGILGADRVICPLHAYEFDLKTGKNPAGRCQELKTYRVWISEQGDIQLADAHE